MNYLEFTIKLSGIIGLYFLWSLGESYMLKAFDYKRSWLAWIPLFNLYAVGDVTRDSTGKTLVLNRFYVPTTLLSCWFIGVVALQFIPYVGIILGLVLQGLCLGTFLVRIYASVERLKGSEVLFEAYLSAFIPLVAIFKFIKYKNRVYVINSSV